MSPFASNSLSHSPRRLIVCASYSLLLCMLATFALPAAISSSPLQRQSTVHFPGGRKLLTSVTTAHISGGTSTTMGGPHSLPERGVLGLKMLMKKMTTSIGSLSSVDSKLNLSSDSSHHYQPSSGSLQMRMKSVRDLWVSVTGQVYPSSALSPSLRGINSSLKNITEEKRLVPGGPDPLHHTSHPFSP